MTMKRPIFHPQYSLDSSYHFDKSSQSSLLAKPSNDSDQLLLSSRQYKSTNCLVKPSRQDDIPSFNIPAASLRRLEVLADDLESALKAQSHHKEDEPEWETVPDNSLYFVPISPAPQSHKRCPKSMGNLFLNPSEEMMETDIEMDSNSSINSLKIQRPQPIHMKHESSRHSFLPLDDMMNDQSDSNQSSNNDDECSSTLTRKSFHRIKGRSPIDTQQIREDEGKRNSFISFTLTREKFHVTRAINSPEKQPAVRFREPDGETEVWNSTLTRPRSKESNSSTILPRQIISPLVGGDRYGALMQRINLLKNKCDSPKQYLDPFSGGRETTNLMTCSTSPSFQSCFNKSAHEGEVVNQPATSSDTPLGDANIKPKPIMNVHSQPNLNYFTSNFSSDFSDQCVSSDTISSVSKTSLKLQADYDNVARDSDKQSIASGCFENLLDVDFDEKSQNIREKKLLRKQVSEEGSVKHIYDDGAIDEACSWLKQTGFPQYAQMFYDKLFPVDVESIREDHSFLDEELLQALFRRIEILNSKSKEIESPGGTSHLLNVSCPNDLKLESDDEEDSAYALSNRWTFEQQTRRWSRLDVNEDDKQKKPIINKSPGHKTSKPNKINAFLKETFNIHSSHHAHKHSKPNSDSKSPTEDTPTAALSRSSSTRGAKPTVLSKFRRNDLGFRSLRRSKKHTDPSETTNTGKVRSALKSGNRPDISGPVHLNSNSTPPMEAAEISIEIEPSVVIIAENSKSQELSLSNDDSNQKPEIQMSTSWNPEMKSSSMHLLSNSSIEGRSFYAVSATPSCTSTPLKNEKHHKSCREFGTSVISDSGEELDPVLDMLLSDMKSLEDFRNVRSNSKSSYREPEDESEKKLSKSLEIPSRSRQHTNLDSSNKNLQNQLSEIDSYDLDKKIRDLVQIERSSGRKHSSDLSASLDLLPLREPTVTPKSYGTTYATIAHVRNRAADNSSLSPSASLKTQIQSPLITEFNPQSANFSREASKESTAAHSPRLASELPKSDSQHSGLLENLLAKNGEVMDGGRDIGCLSLLQLCMLKKLSMLKLTSLMENCSPTTKTAAFNWKNTFRLLTTRSRTVDGVSGCVFGQSFTYWERCFGRPLPNAIYNAIIYLDKLGPQTHGIFRRAGSNTRIKLLREEIEKNPDFKDFSNWQAYDVADAVKQYFRELPEYLMTAKFSNTLINIFATNLSDNKKLEAVQLVMHCLPDENRMVTQILLLFLNRLAKHDAVTQMTPENLSVCLAPSLFCFHHSAYSVRPTSPRRGRRLPTTTCGPDPRELAEQKAGNDCLAMMIRSASTLFHVKDEIILKENLNSNLYSIPNLSTLLCGKNCQSWLYTGVSTLLRDTRSTRGGWLSANRDSLKLYSQICPTVEVHYRRAVSTSSTSSPSYQTSSNAASFSESSTPEAYPLRIWRATTVINAMPMDIFDKIWLDRKSWDTDIVSFEILEELSDSVHICRLKQTRPPLMTPLEYTLLRGKQNFVSQGGHVILQTSVDRSHPKSPGHITPFVLEDNIYIEPCANHPGQSKIHWVSRIDYRGLSLDWYNSNFGFQLGRRLHCLRQSFPESNSISVESASDIDFSTSS